MNRTAFNILTPEEAFRRRAKGGTITALLKNNTDSLFTKASGARAGIRGARSLHAQGKAYRLTSEKAREAARKRWAKKRGEAIM